MPQHTSLTPEQKAELKKQEAALFAEDPNKLPKPPTIGIPGSVPIYGQDFAPFTSGQGERGGAGDNAEVVAGLERISAQIIETQDILTNLPFEIAQEIGNLP